MALLAEKHITYSDIEETLPILVSVTSAEKEQCSTNSSFNMAVKNSPSYASVSQGVETSEQQQHPQNKQLKLWAKAREKLPTLHLQNIEMQSNEEDLGSSVEGHMTIKLRVCIFAILVYLSIGVAAYSYVFENWGIVDSLYFTVVTFTTVGYGDLFPSTEVAKLFTSFYSLVGVSILGVALGVIGSKVMEYKMSVASKADKVLEETILSLLKSSANGSEEKMEQTEDAAHSKCDLSSPEENKANVILVLLRTYTPVFVVLFLGSVVIAWAEGWGWMTAIYYCTLTAVTVGYGDNVPSTELMRLFAVLYIPLLVGVMSHFLGSVASLIMDIQRKDLMQHMRNRSLLLKDLDEMDTDGDGVVTEAEFIVFMLSKMQKVDKDLLDELRQHFRRFDVDHNGSIEKSDLYEVFLTTLRRPRKRLELSQYKTTLLQLSDKGFSSSKQQKHFFDMVGSSMLKSVSALTSWARKDYTVRTSAIETAAANPNFCAKHYNSK